MRASLVCKKRAADESRECGQIASLVRLRKPPQNAAGREAPRIGGLLAPLRQTISGAHAELVPHPGIRRCKLARLSAAAFYPLRKRSAHHVRIVASAIVDWSFVAEFLVR